MEIRALMMTLVQEVSTPESVTAVQKAIDEDRRMTYRQLRDFQIFMYQLSIALLMSFCKYASFVRFGCHIPWVKSSGSTEWTGAENAWKCWSGMSKEVNSINICDESWIYYYGVRTKSQSKICVFEGEEHPTQVRKSRSVGKRMTVIFFGKRGMIKTVALERQKTLTAKSHTETCLPQLMETL